jgi:hypothetical protein
MANIGFESMRNQRAFAVLARLFPDQASTRQLLENAGIEPGRLRPFGQISQELYFREVCRAIDDGAFDRVTLNDLVDAALAEWPGNGTLRQLMGQRQPDGARGSTSGGGELRVLCLAAGPSDQCQLQLAAEHRAIVMAVRRSPRRVLPVLHPATRLDDIAVRLLDARPDIVHFAGHGTPDGQLLFEDDHGLSSPVYIDRLARLFGALGRLRATVLTSCYSGSYTAELLTVSDAVAGSPVPLADRCALAFSENFYRALGENLTARESFDLAVAAMDVVGCPPHTLQFESKEP